MMMILLEMHVTTVSSLPTHYKRILIMMGLEESAMLMTMIQVLVDTDNGSIDPSIAPKCDSVSLGTQASPMLCVHMSVK